MPRSFSSGALSISSKLRAWPPYFSDSTFVMAAVSVVLPWSMCPIVPTLTCGLLRSNFSFATPNYPFLKVFVGLEPELAKHTPNPYAEAPTGSPVRVSTISSAMLPGTSSYRSNCIV